MASNAPPMQGDPAKYSGPGFGPPNSGNTGFQVQDTDPSNSFGRHPGAPATQNMGGGDFLQMNNAFQGNYGPMTHVGPDSRMQQHFAQQQQRIQGYQGGPGAVTGQLPRGSPNPGMSNMGPPSMMPMAPMMRQYSQPNMPLSHPVAPLPRPRSTQTASGGSPGSARNPLPSPHMTSPLAQEMFSSPNYPSPIQRTTVTPQGNQSDSLSGSDSHSQQPNQPQTSSHQQPLNAQIQQQQMQQQNQAQQSQVPISQAQTPMQQHDQQMQFHQQQMMRQQQMSMHQQQIMQQQHQHHQMQQQQLHPQQQQRLQSQQSQQLQQLQQQQQQQMQHCMTLPSSSVANQPNPNSGPNFTNANTHEMPAAFPQLQGAMAQQNPRGAQMVYGKPKRPLMKPYPSGEMLLDPKEPHTFGYFPTNPYYDPRLAQMVPPQPGQQPFPPAPTVPGRGGKGYGAAAARAPPAKKSRAASKNQSNDPKMMSPMFPNAPGMPGMSQMGPMGPMGPMNGHISMGGPMRGGMLGQMPGNGPHSGGHPGMPAHMMMHHGGPPQMVMGYPGHPGLPGHPGQQVQPGQSGHPGQPSQPTQTGPPGHNGPQSHVGQHGHPGNSGQQPNSAPHMMGMNGQMGQNLLSSGSMGSKPMGPSQMGSSPIGQMGSPYQNMMPGQQQQNLQQQHLHQTQQQQAQQQNSQQGASHPSSQSQPSSQQQPQQQNVKEPAFTQAPPSYEPLTPGSGHNSNDAKSSNVEESGQQPMQMPSQQMNNLSSESKQEEFSAAPTFNGFNGIRSFDMDANSVCPGCQGELELSLSSVVRCFGASGCGGIYHLKCSGLNENAYYLLQKDKLVMWRCSNCMTKRQPGAVVHA